jgi:hypothetical protein
LIRRVAQNPNERAIARGRNYGDQQQSKTMNKCPDTA